MLRRAAFLLLLLLIPATAQAFPPVPHNPADALRGIPIDPIVYDSATHCVKHVPVGAQRMEAWLEGHVRGESWGILRCEKWGKNTASLHAEGRAIDWHLDHRVGADRRAGQAFIDELLAPDKDGNEFALARRMGVEELIWNCRYWGAGMETWKPYSVCFDSHGRRKKNVDPTEGHLNHIHIGLTKAGAAARTSFWRTKSAAD